MSLHEQAENNTQRVTFELSRGAVKGTLHVTQAAGDSARQAAAQFRDALTQAINQKMTTGKVSLTTFAQNVNGAREVVSLDDQRVVRELDKELRRYGVTFAVEKQGSARTFHIAGKDAQVTSHALDNAMQRVDDRARRNETKRSLSERIQQRVEALGSRHGRDRTRDLVPDMTPKRGPQR